MLRAASPIPTSSSAFNVALSAFRTTLLVTLFPMTEAALVNTMHQHRRGEPTAYENLLGDALERAFAAGIHDIEGIVRQLNESGPTGPDGSPWTVARLETELARLGA